MKTLYLTPSNTTINVEEDVCFVVDMSERIDAHLKLVFVKEGVSAKVIGAYKGIKDSPIKLVIETIHTVPHTTCTTEVKGVLFDDSCSSFEGRIIIHRHAQQTTSYLAHDVLVIGENTKNESRPILEIEGNDVKASHGATTGRIDKLQSFYLTSRGLKPEDARRLILFGFFDSLLSQIPDEKIYVKVLEYLGISNV